MEGIVDFVLTSARKKGQELGKNDLVRKQR